MYNDTPTLPYTLCLSLLPPHSLDILISMYQRFCNLDISSPFTLTAGINIDELRYHLLDEKIAPGFTWFGFYL